MSLRLAQGSLPVYLCAVSIIGCQSQTPDARLQDDASLRLRPVTTPLPENAIRRTVYVPVYSSIYLGLDIKKTMVDLASTISVRNVSSRYPIVLEFVLAAAVNSTLMAGENLTVGSTVGCRLRA